MTRRKGKSEHVVAPDTLHSEAGADRLATGRPYTLAAPLFGERPKLALAGDTVLIHAFSFHQRDEGIFVTVEVDINGTKQLVSLNELLSAVRPKS